MLAEFIHHQADIGEVERLNDQLVDQRPSNATMMILAVSILASLIAELDNEPDLPGAIQVLLASATEFFKDPKP